MAEGRLGPAEKDAAAFITVSGRSWCGLLSLRSPLVLVRVGPCQVAAGCAVLHETARLATLHVVPVESTTSPHQYGPDDLGIDDREHTDSPDRLIARRAARAHNEYHIFDGSGE